MPFCCLAYTANGIETARTEGQEITADFQSRDSEPVICFLVICLSLCFVLGELVIRNVAPSLAAQRAHYSLYCKGRQDLTSAASGRCRSAALHRYPNGNDIARTEG